MISALDLGGAVVAAALLVVVRLGFTGPARALLALAFVTFVPGWAIVGHVPIVEAMSRVALAAALSLTLCVMATLAGVWLGAWHPIVLLNVLGGLSLVTLAARVGSRSGRFRRSRPAKTTGTVAPDAPVEPGGPPPPAIQAVGPDPAPAAPPATPPVEPAAVEPAAGSATALEPAPALTESVVPESVAPGSRTLRPGDLTLRQVMVRVGLSPSASNEAEAQVQFYAHVHPRHPYESFRRVGQGAFVMETDGFSRFEANRDRASYTALKATGFDVLTGDAVDLFEQFQRHFDLATFTKPSLHLRGAWNPADPVAFSKFMGHLLDVDSRRSLLGDDSGPIGIALHLTGGRGDAPRFEWKLVVEPFENREVILDLTAEYSSVVDRAEVLGDYLHQCHDFLLGNVADFLSSFLDGGGSR